MKKLLVSAAVVAFLLGLAACSGSPTMKVRNDNAASVNVSVKPTGGETINITGVDSGVTSEAKEFAEGEVRVTQSLGTAETTFTAESGTDYISVISNDNPPTLTIETE
jgi:hypothetical protein